MGSTGVVTNSDVVMARESDAAIFAFGKVGIADKETKTLADDAQVPIRNHAIIYRLLDDAREYFGRYPPVLLPGTAQGRGHHGVQRHRGEETDGQQLAEGERKCGQRTKGRRVWTGSPRLQRCGGGGRRGMLFDRRKKGRYLRERIEATSIMLSFSCLFV